jgi:hypothetical protein
MGNPARPSTVSVPSAEKLNTPLLVNAPTLPWMCTRAEGKKRNVTQPTSIVSPRQWDAVYLNKK